MRLFSLMFTVLTLNLALGATAQAACLTRAQIMSGIREWAASYGVQPEVIQPNTSVGGLGLVAAWESIDNTPRFRKCGLALGPNDLRYVQTVNELAGVIAWNLKSK